MEFKDNLQIIRVFRGKKKSDVAKCLGIGRQNLTNWEAGPVEPGTEILDKLSNCLQVPRELFYKKDLTEEYLEKHYSNGNNTPEDKMNDNKQNGHTPRETFYTDLIENNTEYALIPRAVFKDYKIVPDKIIDTIIESKDAERKAMKEAMDMAMESLIKKMDYNNAEADRQLKKAMDENDRLKKENEELLKKFPPKG